MVAFWRGKSTFLGTRQTCPFQNFLLLNEPAYGCIIAIYNRLVVKITYFNIHNKNYLTILKNYNTLAVGLSKGWLVRKISTTMSERTTSKDNDQQNALSANSGKLDEKSSVSNSSDNQQSKTLTHSIPDIPHIETQLNNLPVEQRTQTMLHLQRKYGNQHVQRMVQASPSSAHIAAQPFKTDLLIQRDTPTTRQRLTALERSQRILSTRMSATQSDLRWRATFGERIASYRQAILRISGGLDAATQGFQAAHVEQAQTDALKTQLLGAAMVIIFAAGFEWAVAGMLGRFGFEAGRIKNFIEAVENPANAAASSSVNVAGVATATNSANTAQVPAIPNMGGSVAYLTQNLEGIERHSQLIEQAFVNRSNTLSRFTDDQWEHYNPNAQEAQYQQLLNNLNQSAKGIEQLKAANQVAQILERHLWALWIKRQRENEVAAHRASDEAAQQSGSGSLDIMGRHEEPDHGYDVGSDIESRLNQMGVSALAGVTLTGSWYSRNSPRNWRQLLYQWALNYRESIHT